MMNDYIRTSFTDWLHVVLFENLERDEAILSGGWSTYWRIRELHEAGMQNSIDVLPIIANDGSGTPLGEKVRTVLDMYACYIAAEGTVKRFPSDTCTRKAKDLSGGFSLWRCNNESGIPFSLVRSPKGLEIMSITSDRERDLLQRFAERLPSLRKTFPEVG